MEIVAEGAASVGGGRGSKSINFHLVRNDCVTSGLFKEAWSPGDRIPRSQERGPFKLAGIFR